VGVAVYGLGYLVLSRGKPEQALIQQQAGTVIGNLKRMAARHKEEPAAKTKP